MAGEPNDVASGVHVKGNSLGAQSKGKGIIAAGIKWKRDLAAVWLWLFFVVAVETGGRVGGGGFEKVRSGVELGFGKGVC